MNETLQNPLQHAVAKVSLEQSVCDKVVEVCAGMYLPVGDLYHKPEVRALVRDTNHLSVILSGGYKSGRLGRVNYHHGTTRFAYGAPDPSVAMISQKKGAAARVKQSPAGAKKPVITANRPYTLTLEFSDAEEALAFMFKHGLVSKAVRS